ncbi:MAG: hypothetical protein WD425_04955, partial [Nitrospirales bacterium]
KQKPARINSLGFVRQALISIKGQIKKFIAIAYAIRPESEEIFQQLKQQGLDVAMLTEDRSSDRRSHCIRP